MKLLVAALALALLSWGAGCTSNPTPYPGQPDGQGTDESPTLEDGVAAPDPNADRETCEQLGGDWLGDSCYGAEVPGGDVIDGDGGDATDDAEVAEPGDVEPGPSDVDDPS